MRASKLDLDRDLGELIGSGSYLLMQQFAVLLINQYAQVHDEGFRLVSTKAGEYQFHLQGRQPNERELASLEGMLRLGVPSLWIVPTLYGAIGVLTSSVGSLVYLLGSVFFVIGVFGWYFASKFSSKTTVEGGLEEGGSS